MVNPEPAPPRLNPEPEPAPVVEPEPSPVVDPEPAPPVEEPPMEDPFPFPNDLNFGNQCN